MNEHERYHHGNLHAELIRLGLTALESEGAEALSLRSLSEQAGVSKTAPYRHFRDKEAFLCALADEGFRLLCEALERVDMPPSGGGGPGQLAAMGRAYMANALARPELYRLMNSPLSCRLPPQNALWARRSLLLLARALGKRPSISDDRPALPSVPALADPSSGSAGEIDSDAAAAAWGYIHGLVLLRIDGLFPADLAEPDWDRLAGMAPFLDAAGKR